jgi:hypothetical protein
MGKTRIVKTRIVKARIVKARIVKARIVKARMASEGRERKPTAIKRAKPDPRKGVISQSAE